MRRHLSRVDDGDPNFTISGFSILLVLQNQVLWAKNVLISSYR